MFKRTKTVGTWGLGGLALVWMLGGASCGGDSGGAGNGGNPVGPGSPGGPSTVCSQLTLTSQGDLLIAGCSSVQATIANTQFNSLGQRTAYEFNITCTTSGQTFSGNVTSLEYNSLGQVTGATLTVNGQSCRLSR